MLKRIEKIERIDKPRLGRKMMGLALSAHRRGSNKVLEVNVLRRSKTCTTSQAEKQST